MATSLCLVVLLVPLLVAPGQCLFPFVFPKAVAFQSLVLLAAAAAIAEWRRFDGSRRCLAIDVAVGFAITAIVVSACAGVDRARSFFDTGERMLGVVAMLHFVLYYVTLSASLSGTRDWRRPLRWIVATAVVVAAVAWVQKARPGFLADPSDPRVASTLGQPSELAEFSLQAALIAALLASQARGLRRAAYSAAAVLSLTAIFLTETRGSMIAVVAAALTGALAFACTAPRGRRRRWVVVVGAAAATLVAVTAPIVGLEDRLLAAERRVALARCGLVLRSAGAEWTAAASASVDAARGYLEGVAGLSGAELADRLRAIEVGRVVEDRDATSIDEQALTSLAPPRDATELRLALTSRLSAEEHSLSRVRAVYDWVRKVPGLRRVARSTVTRKTVEVRQMLWRSAVDAARDRPWVGWGPGNFAYAFQEHFPPRVLYASREETWFDDAHDVFLNTLAEQGLLGLSALLVLMLTPIAVVWRRWRGRQVSRSLVVFTSAFVVGQATHDAFAFPGIASTLVFFTVLAVLQTALRDPCEPARSRGSPVRSAAAVGVVTAIVLALLRPVLAANTAARDSVAALRRGHISDALAAIDRSTAEGGPYRVDHQTWFAGAVIQVAGDLITGRSRSTSAPEAERWTTLIARLRPAVERAHDALIAAVDERPLDVRLRVQQAKIALLAHSQWSDAETLAVAERSLAVALGAAPLRQDVRFLLAEIRMRLGHGWDDVIPLLAGAADSAPELAESWVRLARASARYGRWPLVGDALDKAEGAAYLREEDRAGIRALRSEAQRRP